MVKIVVDSVEPGAVLEQRPVGDWLSDLGEDIIEVALGIYESRAKGYETSPYIYTESFDFDVERSSDLDYTLTVFNTDPTALAVEYGSHAGGKTKVLGYAPIRQAVRDFSVGDQV